jgi:nickel-dependent lactate racemase
MYRIPFSKTYLDFELPATMRGTYLTSRPVEPLADVGGAIAKALADPINSPPLQKVARRGDTVCIVFTDITRDSPDYLLVPALLAELETAGVRDADITLLCGTGLHSSLGKLLLTAIGWWTTNHSTGPDSRTWASLKVEFPFQ